MGKCIFASLKKKKLRYILYPDLPLKKWAVLPDIAVSVEFQYIYLNLIKQQQNYSNQYKYKSFKAFIKCSTCYDIQELLSHHRNKAFHGIEKGLPVMPYPNYR